jgi:hypothetical protein
MYDGKKESFCPEQADLDLLECVSWASKMQYPDHSIPETWHMWDC